MATPGISPCAWVYTQGVGGQPASVPTALVMLQLLNEETLQS